MGAVLVGRQPILDTRRRLYGYELLFRDDKAPIEDVDPHLASCQVVTNTLLEIGFDRLVGTGRAFVNVGRQFLSEGWHLLLPQDRTVLEVLETEVVDDELLDLVQAARRDGYMAAADDITFEPHQRPLVDVVDIVKIDLPNVDPDDFALMAEWGSSSTAWLAEKVETPDDLAVSTDAGFQLFQGYHFLRPEVLTGSRPGSNRVAVLRLVGELLAEEPSVERMAEIIESDPTLVYKLLATVNSSRFALPAEVTSVSKATMLLGTVAVHQLALLLSLSSVSSKPSALLHTSLVRARMCDAVGTQLALTPGAGFTVGLLSLMDAFLDQPLDEALAGLPLRVDLEAAIVHRQGALGVILNAVERWERGDLAGVERLLGGTEVATHLAHDAITWATELLTGAEPALTAGT